MQLHKQFSIFKVSVAIIHLDANVTPLFEVGFFRVLLKLINSVWSYII